MSTQIDELSALPPKYGRIHNLSILSNLKSLAQRCQRAVSDVELDEIVCDVELMENKAQDFRTRGVLEGFSKVMRQRLQDYATPMMTEFIEIISRDPFHSQKMVIMTMLLNIGTMLLIPGEVYDTHPSGGHERVIPQPGFYDLSQEMKLKLPKKRHVFRQMSPVSSTVFCERWSLIKTECQFRNDAVNTIREVNVNIDGNPGQPWNLTEQQFTDDMNYLRRIYRERNMTVILTRWEWGRKFWTLHAKRLDSTGADANIIVNNGREMEMAARQLLFQHNLI